MKKFLFLILIPTMVAAQQTINGLNIKGKLDVISTTKSSNPCPSMTEAQRDLITVPAIGSCVYNTNALSLNIYDGAEWKSAGGGGISLWLTLTNYKIDDVVIDSNKIYKSLSDHTSGVFATDLANGDWVELSASEIVDLTTDVTGILPIANGGTGTSIKNFVDLASSQSVGGNKSFQNGVAVQGDLLTYGAVQTTLNEGMVSTDAAGNLIKGVLRPEIDLENQRLGFNYGGDDNLIPNGSFENTVEKDNWNCSSGVGTVGESNVSVADGVKSLKVGLGTGASYCYQDNIVIPSANVGKEHIYSITVSSDRMLDFCAVGSSLDQNCVRYNPGNGPQLLTTFYTPTTTTGNGLIIKSVNLLAGDMYIDKASMKVVTPSESSKSISNLNSLTDPSFEKGLVVGWQLSGVGNLTTSATEVLDLPRNKKALMVDSSTTTNVLTASWSTAIPPAGVSGVCSGWVKTPNALTAEVASNSTRIAFKAIEGTNVWQYFEMYFKTDGTHTPTCRFLNATATIYHLDEMFFGLKESPINITSFKNDGSWRPCTFSTLAWSGYGTVTNNLDCKRDGTNLKIRGDFINGTVASANVIIPLPTNFGSISYVKKSANHSVGFSLRVLASQFVLQNIFVNSTAGDNGLYSSGSIVAAAINPLSATQGAGNFATGERISISGELSIPIAEWSENTNGALITCKEGPLKCANVYSANVSNPVVSEVNIPNWLSCVSGGTGIATCTVNASVGLTSPMNCTATFSKNLEQSSAGYIQILPISVNQINVRTYNLSANLANYAVDLNCMKTVPDYNAGYEKVLGFTEDADIRSTEWLTGGFDYISGKSIYRRCFSPSSVINNTTELTLATWGSGLRLVGESLVYHSGGYYIKSLAATTGGNYRYLFYYPADGRLSTVSTNASFTIRVGEPICINYTKP